ncbi:hypothetical protein HSB1_06500 [Halogranum salarium B-1]|uniref:Uncharacterized protein n=1 Tax=Halogranum salarium B-1 TaxID=1210908 RepID=J3JI66_9EURY|nr:hypothetical protein HSB1_06500 [Halogranum salarium B-1]
MVSRLGSQTVSSLRLRGVGYVPPSHGVTTDTDIVSTRRSRR